MDLWVGPRATGAELKTQLGNTSTSKVSSTRCPVALRDTAIPKLNHLGLSNLDTQSVGRTRNPPSREMQPEPGSPASPSVWPPLPPSDICSRCSPSLKGTAFAFFPCDLQVRFTKGDKYRRLCERIYTDIDTCFPVPHPRIVMALGIRVDASYLHLCKANPGHWSPHALHGWPLSIRPSPVNFKTKRQHNHVSTTGAPSKAPLVSQAG